MPTAVCPLVLLLPVEHQRLARMEDLRREPLSVGHWRLRPALTVLVVVGELDLSGGHVVQRHIRDVGIERLAHPLSDQLDQRVEIELRSECLPDAVDRRELGHALPGLVHEPSVVERDAQAAGKRRQQALIRLARMRASGPRSGARSRRSRDRRRRAGRRAPSGSDRRSAQTGCRSARPPPRVISSSISGSRVSITCLRKPISGIGFSCSRSPRSITYGKREQLCSPRRRRRC